MNKSTQNNISNYIEAEVKNNINILALPQKSNTIYLKSGFDFVSFDCNSIEITSWDSYDGSR